MDHSAVTTPTYLGNMISAADISAELNAEEKKRRLDQRDRRKERPYV